MNWAAFAISFGLFVIVPVWIFNIVSLSIIWKIGFTLAGAFGIWTALEYGTIGRRR
jgi:predicted outer membrane lipoprotein